MLESDYDRNPPLTVAPTLKLSRRGLVLGFIVMAAAGLSVYAMFPDSVGGPELPVDIRLENRPVETTNGMGAVVTEVVVIRNLADYSLGQLQLKINGDYWHTHRSLLESGKELVFPQANFTNKKSSHRFDPSTHEVEDVMVAGQLPNGARGVTKIEFK